MTAAPIAPGQDVCSVHVNLDHSEVLLRSKDPVWTPIRIPLCTN